MARRLSLDQTILQKEMELVDSVPAILVVLRSSFPASRL